MNISSLLVFLLFLFSKSICAAIVATQTFPSHHEIEKKGNANFVRYQFKFSVTSNEKIFVNKKFLVDENSQTIGKSHQFWKIQVESMDVPKNSKWFELDAGTTIVLVTSSFNINQYDDVQITVKGFQWSDTTNENQSLSYFFDEPIKIDFQSIPEVSSVFFCGMFGIISCFWRKRLI